MDYAIIGSGALGSALARQFARMKQQVGLANSKGPETMTALIQDLGSDVVPLAIEQARLAKLVILATPFEAAKSALGDVGDWEGRILVDATNALNWTDFTPLDLGGRPSTDVVAEAAPGARVVKAFNHLWARILAREASDDRGAHRVMFLSGNEPTAKKDVAELMHRMGFAPIDLGRLDGGGLLSSFGGPLTTLSLVSQAVGGASAPEMDLLHP